MATSDGNTMSTELTAETELHLPVISEEEASKRTPGATSPGPGERQPEQAVITGDSKSTSATKNETTRGSGKEKELLTEFKASQLVVPHPNQPTIKEIILPDLTIEELSMLENSIFLIEIISNELQNNINVTQERLDTLNDKINLVLPYIIRLKPEIRVALKFALGVLHNLQFEVRNKDMILKDSKNTTNRLKTYQRLHDLCIKLTDKTQSDDALIDEFSKTYDAATNDFPPISADESKIYEEASKITIITDCMGKQRIFVSWRDELGVKIGENAEDKAASVKDKFNQEIVKAAADSVAAIGTSISLLTVGGLFNGANSILILCIIFSSMNILAKGLIYTVNWYKNSWGQWFMKLVTISVYIIQILIGLSLTAISGTV
jgi:hypothetical protein